MKQRSSSSEMTRADEAYVAAKKAQAFIAECLPDPLSCRETSQAKGDALRYIMAGCILTNGYELSILANSLYQPVAKKTRKKKTT